MKRLFWIAMMGLGATLAAPAQTVDNPVVSTARELFTRQSKYIVAAAEQMPAEKYGYRPTSEQWSFAKITSHISTSGTAICGMLSDKPATTVPKVSDTDAKDAQVAALKASFAYCDQALTNLTDAQMGDPITYFRGEHKPRARALFELTNDVEDHYSQLASYLRLNGITPPSAQPKK